MVNAHELQFTTESVVPATSVLLNNKPVETAGVATKAVGVRPMDIKSLTSMHAVTLAPKAPLAVIGKPVEWLRLGQPSHRCDSRQVPFATWLLPTTLQEVFSNIVIEKMPRGYPIFLP